MAKSSKLVAVKRGRRQVVAVARNQAHGPSLPVRQYPEAVVLDLVNPSGSSRRVLGRAREAGLKQTRELIGLQSPPKFTHYGRHQKASASAAERTIPNPMTAIATGS